MDQSTSASKAGSVISIRGLLGMEEEKGQDPEEVGGTRQAK